MRIAFTHNLQLSDREEEAEFDSPATVAAIQQALASLGHDVELVEVSGPASQTVARLEALQPDLVFNTAEGRRGRFREAFYPGLFEELGIPFTGSDAYVCAVTLDKALTKLVLEPHGVKGPRGVFVDGPDARVPEDLRFPVIIKPNYEGSSKGITQDSVVEDRPSLLGRLDAIFKAYPSGVLIEEYITGRDIVVPFLAFASPETGGVLPAVEYEFDPAIVAGRKYLIYEYDLKQSLSSAVSVRVPAHLSTSVAERVRALSRIVYRVLGVRDLGRIDFRVTPEGDVYFIEINALPSLERGAGIYLAAEKAGLTTMSSVLNVVVESALRRYGIEPKKTTRSARGRLRVGLAYNLKRLKPAADGLADHEAEYDTPDTIQAIVQAIASYGHDVVELEASSELPSLLGAGSVDVVFNIAEGIRGRSREAQVPALLELMGIEYTGSDPATLSLALDKALAKRVVRQAGVRTPAYVVLATGGERFPKDLTFPAIVKPVAEGSSKGVLGTSVAEDEASARAAARAMIQKYRQPAIVESYLPGREFTVGLLGERRPRVLPPMEVVFTDPSDERPIYAFEHKLAFSDKVRYDAPATVDPRLLKEIEKTARAVFTALDCRDVARVDLRLDGEGHVNFIECNPLPGLTPDWSDLCLIGKSAGMDYRTLIGEILAPAIKRLRARRRERERDRRAAVTQPDGAA